MPRTVIPGLCHHVTQRGNRRQPTFLEESDYPRYLDHMRWSCRRFGVEVWAYCLMPNHSHLALVPPTEEALRKAVGEAHQRYTAEINHREGWTGHLWQGRFSSFVMDVPHTLAAARYIELNPVRAGLVEFPEQWPWSSARAHLAGVDDDLVTAAPLLSWRPDWKSLLWTEGDAQMVADLRKHRSTGRPLGDDAFLDGIELQLLRSVRPLPWGRPPT